MNKIGAALRVAFLSGIFLGLVRCSSDPPKPTPGGVCDKNTDCDNPLVCTFEKCHGQCRESRDCPGGQHCLGLKFGGVCQLDVENVECVYASDCFDPLVCAVDSKCRVPCAGDKDCLASQLCVSHVCADEDELSDGGALPQTNPTGGYDGTPVSRSDGGANDKDGGPGSGGKSGAGGASGGDVDASAGGGEDGGPISSSSGGKTGKGGASSTGSGGAGEVPPPSCGDAGVSGFHPSNLPVDLEIPDGAVDLTNFNNFFDTGNAAPNPTAPYWDDYSGTPAATQQTVVTLTDGREATVLFVKSLTLPAGKAFRIAGVRPLIVVSKGPVSIEGNVFAIADPVHAWFAGGAPTTTTLGRAGSCPIETVAGGGRAGSTNSNLGIGPAGGGFCGAGGPGSTDLTGTARPKGGVPYGTETLVPLVGGSAGGTGYSGNGGHGGGAIQIVSGTAIVVGEAGWISMGGGAGTASAGGAGSGGAILLEAPTVTIRGLLATNGGAGGDYSGGGQEGQASGEAALAYGASGKGGAGDNAAGSPGNPAGTAIDLSSGGGGVGRIRINTGCGGKLTVSANAVISPSEATGCYTTGELL